MGDMKAWKADWPDGRMGESRPPVKPTGRRSGGESAKWDGSTRLVSIPVLQVETLMQCLVASSMVTSSPGFVAWGHAPGSALAETKQQVFVPSVSSKFLYLHWTIELGSWEALSQWWGLRPHVNIGKPAERRKTQMNCSLKVQEISEFFQPNIPCVLGKDTQALASETKAPLCDLTSLTAV